MRAGEKSGQSIAEYAVLVLAIVGAIFAMQTYYRRGVQAKIRDLFVAVGLKTQRVESIDEAEIGVTINENTVSGVKQTTVSKFQISEGHARYVETTSSTSNTIRESM